MLVNSVYINVQANMAAVARRINMDIFFFLPIANYPQSILNQYQEVGQKPVHTDTPKKIIITQTITYAYGSYQL